MTRFVIEIEESDLTNFNYDNVWIEIDGLNFKVTYIRNADEVTDPR